MRKWTALLGLFILIFLILAACGSEREERDTGGIMQDEGKSTLVIPEGKDNVEKLKKLWDITKPIIQADEKAKLTDDQYLEKRNDVFGVWVDLQIENSTNDTNSGVSQLLPRILELVDHVYGFPGFTQEEREEERENTGRTEYLIEDIEEKIAALPG